jgi:hypothetical protein
LGSPTATAIATVDRELREVASLPSAAAGSDVEMSAAVMRRLLALTHHKLAAVLSRALMKHESDAAEAREQLPPGGSMDTIALEGGEPWARALIGAYDVGDPVASASADERDLASATASLARSVFAAADARPTDQRGDPRRAGTSDAHANETAGHEEEDESDQVASPDEGARLAVVEQRAKDSEATAVAAAATAAAAEVALDGERTARTRAEEETARLRTELECLRSAAAASKAETESEEAATSSSLAQAALDGVDEVEADKRSATAMTGMAEELAASRRELVAARAELRASLNACAAKHDEAMHAHERAEKLVTRNAELRREIDFLRASA